MMAFALVYDSSANWDDKAPYLEGSDSLQSSNESYMSGASTMGGISLVPKSAVVEGETATITYDVMFGESAAYEDLTREVLLVDGLWTVSSEDYCDFLASARTPCLVETSVSEVAADEAAMMAFALVYDSSANWDDKAPYLEGSDSLQSSNESYMSGASTMGGISLVPKSAVVEGETATITYDVMFGESAAYEDLTREVLLVDGLWTVSSEDYCDFLASARTPCLVE